MREISVLAAAGICLFLAYRNNLEASLTASDWQETSTKVSESASPILKHYLPIIGAFLLTGFVGIILAGAAGTIIYPIETCEDGKLDFNKDAYRDLSIFSKVSKALTLVAIGTAFGAGFGGVMMKRATTALQLGPSYFRTTTTILTACGAVAGAGIAMGYHDLFTQTEEC